MKRREYALPILSTRKRSAKTYIPQLKKIVTIPALINTQILILRKVLLKLITGTAFYFTAPLLPSNIIQRES